MSERFIDADTVEALSRLRGELPRGIAAAGPWLEVPFLVAGSTVDVKHGLGAVPTGYEIILSLGGQIRATRVHEWTGEIALLVADTNNTRVRMRFLLTSEAPIDAT